MDARSARSNWSSFGLISHIYTDHWLGEVGKSQRVKSCIRGYLVCDLRQFLDVDLRHKLLLAERFILRL